MEHFEAEPATMETIPRRAFLKGMGVAATAAVVPACDRQLPQGRAPRPSYGFLDTEGGVHRGGGRAPDPRGRARSRRARGGRAEVHRPPARRRLGRRRAALPQRPVAARARRARATSCRSRPRSSSATRCARSTRTSRSSNRAVPQAGAQDQDAYLDALQKGSATSTACRPNVFFESLLDTDGRRLLRRPGVRRQPRHGGWKLIGFPGAYANYYELVDQHGSRSRAPPVSLAQDARGHVHLHPVHVVPAAKEK